MFFHIAFQRGLFITMIIVLWFVNNLCNDECLCFCSAVQIQSLAGLHSERPSDELVMICLFCDTLMFSHLREAFQCEGRGFSITLGYFLNRTAGARLPDPHPQPAVSVCLLEHVETKQQTARLVGKLTELGKSTAGFGESKDAICSISLQLWKAVWVQLDTKCIFFFFPSPLKKRPSGLTEPFILYYSSWLLTPGELCSQIDALLLWGCSCNIKLYWNIHMWVHLAESNWCATPQRPDGNVSGPSMHWQTPWALVKSVIVICLAWSGRQSRE